MIILYVSFETPFANFMPILEMLHSLEWPLSMEKIHHTQPHCYHDPGVYTFSQKLLLLLNLVSE